MATRNFETEPKQQRQSQRGYSGNLYCLRDGVLNPAEGEWENSTATATTATTPTTQSNRSSSRLVDMLPVRIGAHSRPVDMQPVRIGALKKCRILFKTVWESPKKVQSLSANPRHIRVSNRRRPGEIEVPSKTPSKAPFKTQSHSAKVHKMANSVGLELQIGAEGSYIASEELCTIPPEARAQKLP